MPYLLFISDKETNQSTEYAVAMEVPQLTTQLVRMTSLDSDIYLFDFSSRALISMLIACCML